MLCLKRDVQVCASIVMTHNTPSYYSMNNLIPWIKLLSGNVQAINFTLYKLDALCSIAIAKGLA